MLIKIIRKNLTKNIKVDILSTSALNLASTKNLDKINLKNYQNKTITVKKINLSSKKNYQNEKEIHLFNIDPSRFFYKSDLYNIKMNSKIIKSKIKPEINFLNLKNINNSLLNSSEIIFFLKNHISENEEIPYKKLNEILTNEIITKKK